MDNKLFKFYDWCDCQKGIKEFLIFSMPMLFLIMGVHGSSVYFSISCGTILFLILVTRIFHIFYRIYHSKTL